MVGKKINKWTIVKPTDLSSSSVAVCRCECGFEKVISLYDLYSDRSTQCNDCANKSRSEKMKIINKKYHAVPTGTIINDFKVLSKDENCKHKAVRWLCECKCGIVFSASAPQVRKGIIKNCPKCSRFRKSLNNQTQRQHPLYNTWEGIKKRCYYEKHNAYPNYGARGITMCEAWKNDFWAFAKEIPPKPTCSDRSYSIDPNIKIRYTLDRIDNNGNYEPGNMRWANPKIQSNNTRTAKSKKYEREMITVQTTSKNVTISYVNSDKFNQ